MLTGIKSGIHSCYKALAGSFLITGSSVYLTGIEEACNTLSFQRWIKLGRFYKVIFYGVSRAALYGIFKARHCTHKGILYTFRQAGRKPVKVDFVSFKTCRFYENLMSVAFLKAHNLVFDRRTIARTNAADFTAVQRRASNIIADDFMSFFICINNVAVY